MPDRLFALLLLCACGAPSEKSETGTTDERDGGKGLATATEFSPSSCAMRCYESMDVDAIPDIALDRPFTYMVRYMVSRGDPRILISTVIPHTSGMTYKLVDEGLAAEDVWKVTFQAFDDASVEKGLFVHTGLRVPWMVEGKAITEVEVAVLDQSGNSTPEVGGVPGEPKTKKPMRRTMAHTRDEDPALPPLEDVAIYANGGLVEGDQFVVGFARVNGSGSGLTLTNNTTTYEVAFASTTGGAAHEFLYFDHLVTDLGPNPAICTFADGDGDSGTDPRPNVQVP